MAGLTTVYINGNVFTVDVKRPWAQAFAVGSTGRFVKVGSNQDVLGAYHGGEHRVIDLGGRFIMPGIHDAHTHLLAAAMQQLFEISIGEDCTHETFAHELQKKCQCARAHDTDDWLIANFYSGNLFPNG